MTILSHVRKLFGSDRVQSDLNFSVQEIAAILDRHFDCQNNIDKSLFEFQHYYSLQNPNIIMSYSFPKSPKTLLISLVQYRHELNIPRNFTIKKIDTSIYLFISCDWKSMETSIRRKDFEIFEICGERLLLRFDSKSITKENISKQIIKINELKKLTNR